MSGLPKTVTGPIPAVPTHTGVNRAASPEPEKTAWGAIAALALGMFILVTIEQLPIGVLTLISEDLHVSRGTVGLSVTFPGVLAGLIALVVPVVTAQFNRKTVLVTSLVAVIVSCAASLAAPTYEFFLASRIFTGIAIGLYWPVLPLLAGSHARSEHRATAFTLAYAGIGSALVLGLPLATWLGAVLGWRGSFAATGALAVVSLFAVLVLVHPAPAARAETLRSTLTAGKIRGVRYAFVLTLIIVTAQFVSYSFISPILQDIGRVPVRSVSAFLLAYGICGIVGNFSAGPLIRKSAAIAVLVLAGGISMALILVGVAMSAPANALVIVCVWGLFGGMASVSIQALVSAEAGDREEAGTALNSAAFNLSIGLGAVIGGVIVDFAGLRSAIWVSTGAMLTAVAVITRFIVLQQRRPSTL